MMTHPLEQHDELYRKAFEKYRQHELREARILAEAAADKVHEYLLHEDRAVPADHYTCRAQALLRLINENVPEADSIQD
jgi:hypothetical protein